MVQYSLPAIMVREPIILSAPPKKMMSQEWPLSPTNAVSRWTKMVRAVPCSHVWKWLIHSCANRPALLSVVVIVFQNCFPALMVTRSVLLATDIEGPGMGRRVALPCQCSHKTDEKWVVPSHASNFWAGSQTHRLTVDSVCCPGEMQGLFF